MTTDKIKIFLVDDDALLLKSLEIEFLAHGDFDIETYATGELCVQNIAHNPDVIILDYHYREFFMVVNSISNSLQASIQTVSNCRIMSSISTVSS